MLFRTWFNLTPTLALNLEVNRSVNLGLNRIPNLVLSPAANQAVLLAPLALVLDVPLAPILDVLRAQILDVVRAQILNVARVRSPTRELSVDNEDAGVAVEYQQPAHSCLARGTSQTIHNRVPLRVAEYIYGKTEKILVSSTALELLREIGILPTRRSSDIICNLVRSVKHAIDALSNGISSNYLTHLQTDLWQSS